MSEEKVSISVQLPLDRHDELVVMAIETGVLKSNIVRNLIYEALDKRKKDMEEK